MNPASLLLRLLSHRTLALLRWDLHFLQVRFKNRVQHNDRLLLDRIRAAQGPLYLNLGSGPRGLADPHWINVDGFMDTNVHYCLDFNRPWPFESNSFDGIFCEHVMEHFTLEEGRTILEKCFRVLKPGGCVRFIQPDGEKIIGSYLHRPAELMEHRPADTGEPMESVNSYFRQRYEHQCIYDWGLLSHQLTAVGFFPVLRASYLQAELSKPVLLDDEKYAWESLYVEALRPANGASPRAE